MATQDVQISDLTQVNTPATTDLLLIRHGTVDSKITYSDIKSAINTNTLYASSDGVVTDQANQYYNRSQVDAKVTNLQNQINTLNSKTAIISKASSGYYYISVGSKTMWFNTSAIMRLDE